MNDYDPDTSMDFFRALLRMRPPQPDAELVWRQVQQIAARKVLKSPG